MSDPSVVVLLDPLRPLVFPAEALPYLAGPVEVSSDVPEEVRRCLPRIVPGSDVLVAMDGDCPPVGRERVIRAAPVQGDRLVEAVSIMDRLFRRGGWEARQTHESLSAYLVEETYEVLDAIRSQDTVELREELGDLLLQVLFHARISQGIGGFDVDAVAEALIEKLVHRSPHLKSSGVVDIAEQERAWERLKSIEKARASAMDGIARSQPPLLLAEKVRVRASRPELAKIVEAADLGAAIEECCRADAALAARLDVLIDRIRSYESGS
ncbi:XTP/dITP diphosphohydrolase [Rhodococcus sp. 27YEA15]|uniref:MazG family protein n=1 Tax=Rhodococcus sp. 27YEA15 TaxID=3156259 RepID=UPI003C7B789F